MPKPAKAKAKAKAKPKPVKPAPRRKPAEAEPDRPYLPPSPPPAKSPVTVTVVPGDLKHDAGHIRRFCDGIEALLGGPLNNSDAQDLGAIGVRMSAWDRDRLLAILTQNAEG